MRKLSIHAILIVLTMVGSIAGQSNPFRLRANLSVTDEKGNPVTGLSADEITIIEDGQEHKVLSLVEKKPVLNLGIVVDNTGSMRFKMRKLRYIANSIIDGIRDGDKAFIIRFVSSGKIEVWREWTSKKGSLKKQIKKMYVEGGQTAIIDAVYLSSQKLIENEKKAGDERHAVVLISDGVGRASYYTPNQLLSLFSGFDSQIFTFSFPENEARKQIKDSKRRGRRYNTKMLLLNNYLATKTGGAAITLSKGSKRKEIDEKVQLLLRELKSGYIVEYIPKNKVRNRNIFNRSVRITPGKDGSPRIGSINPSVVLQEQKKIEF